MASESKDPISSSLEAFSEEAGTVHGLQPYLFEPLAQDYPEKDEPEEEDILEPNPDLEGEARLENKDWCKCDHCDLMPTVRESFCCQERQEVTKKITQYNEKYAGAVKCITTHPGFEPVCLNIWSLETAYLQYHQQYGPVQGPLNERYRYIAYRQLVRWCWGWLGRQNRVVLPACAVHKIRNQFPPFGHHDESDTKPSVDPVPSTDDIHVYGRRWYILVLFASLCCVQPLVWNAFGPLSDSAGHVYGWSSGDIALLSNWGPIAFLLSTAFFAWLLDVKGLRAAALVTATVITAGAGLRCITSTKPAAIWLIHVGQFLNGLGAPVATGGGTLLSSHWFPAHQRTTATAFMTGLNYFGIALSYIIGPLVVPEREWENTTLPLNMSSSREVDLLPGDIAETQKDIMKLLYIEFGIAATIFLLLLIYFPNKPPKPPSITASVERVDFTDGLKRLVRHRPFWMLAVPYTISGGVFAGWSAVLHVNLKPLGVSEIEAGWLGFYSILAAIISCLVIGRFADVFKKRMKLYIMILFSVAFVVFAIFTFSAQGFIPFSKGLMYPCLLLGAACVSGVAPLFFELCCETTYPIAEGVTTTFVAWIFNMAMMFFLVVMMIPNIGTSWLNWCLTVGVGLCVPVMCVVDERYTRLDIDTQQGGTVGQTNTQHECTRL